MQQRLTCPSTLFRLLQQPVVCDADGNCSVHALVRAAASPSGSSDLMRIDCTRPDVVAALRREPVLSLQQRVQVVDRLRGWVGA